MYTLCFYVPESALEQVKAAVFAAGAGRIGNYDQCCWQVAGQGQFRPLAGSNPAIGRQGAVASGGGVPGGNGVRGRTHRGRRGGHEGGTPL